MRSEYKKIKWYFGKEIEIPEEWGIKFINKLGHIVTGNTPTTLNEEYFGNDCLWASPKDFVVGKYVKKTLSKLSNKGMKISRQIPKDSVMVVCIGSTIGKINLSAENMTTNQQINSIICKKHDPHFIYYQLFFHHYLIRNVANQVAVPILNKTNFGKIKIFAPKKIKEQQKIASILSNVDACIAATRNVIEKTENLKKGLMQKLLTRGIGHTKFKKVKWMFGKEIEIPKKWDIKPIEKIFTFISTGTNSRKELGTGNYHYIHYGDIHTKWDLVLDCDLDEIPRIEEDKVQNVSLLREGDLIIADASEDHEGSGSSVLIKNIKNRKIVSGLHTIVLHDKNDQTNSNFRAYLTSIHSVKIQIIAYITGVSVYGLSKKNLKMIRIPIPPKTEQEKIASILSGVDAYIQKNQEYKEKLEILKKGLMQKLLTGKIRVKYD